MFKELAKTKLAKSVNDGGWGQFVSILSIKAVACFPQGKCWFEGNSCKSKRH